MHLHQMDRFVAHCNRFFRQSDPTVLHAADDRQPHIDVLVYKPNEAFPFWKLVTMGASDIKMPRERRTLGRRNEYVMFISPDEDMENQKIRSWYYSKLMTVAHYPLYAKRHITYGHSIEWSEEANSDMVAAFLEMPQMIRDVNVVRCRLSLFKTTVMLQVIPITRYETHRLLKIGPEAFSSFLYPENGAPHFLCEKNRSSRF